MKLIKSIQDKIEEKKAEKRRKKLVKQFENMPDDELMDFVSEREDDVIDGDSETKETVTEAIKQIGESEEQVKLLTETPIGDELTGVQKTEIAKTISPMPVSARAGPSSIIAAAAEALTARSLFSFSRSLSSAISLVVCTRTMPC